MKIIYKEENHEENPTFADVEEDQFFVCGRALFQKSNSKAACQITDSKGRLFSVYDIEFPDDASIDKILPEVAKIEY